MSPKKGVIALMGSGELTATMVEVHKELLGRTGEAPRAVFLDTPAGFQLNVDQLSQRAVAYFRDHVRQAMSVASFKSLEDSSPLEAEKAFHTLRQAHYVLIGPGSPTYAVRQWRETPIPDILASRVEEGGCLVAASAAALTVGRFTLPVYEIYKVGEAVHWVEGMDLLSRFGFHLVVVPHWNNAEGGTHDTRFCYMGEPRFRRLESLLPEDVSVLGLEEHTACLIDLERDEAAVKGIGRVILRRHGGEHSFERGQRFSLGMLRGDAVWEQWKEQYPVPEAAEAPEQKRETSFWDEIHRIEDAFHRGLEDGGPGEATNALLELDRAIWEAHQDLESGEFISQARDILREMVVSLGVKLDSCGAADPAERLAPLVEELLALRERLRQSRQWGEADAIRDSLQRAGVMVEDTSAGPRWHVKASGGGTE